MQNSDPNPEPSLPVHQDGAIRDCTTMRGALREARPFLLGTAIALVLSWLVGYFGHDAFAHWIRSFRQSLANATVGGYWAEVGKTLFHNAILDYLALRLGYATFGLIPAAFLVANGLFVGAFVGHVVPADRLGTIALLAPHGIFELLAMVLSVGLGVWFGTQGRFRHGLRPALKGVHAVFLSVILPLATVAALIETWDFTDWRPRFTLEPTAPRATAEPHEFGTNLKAGLGGEGVALSRIHAVGSVALA